jgi:hypothetical protein
VTTIRANDTAHDGIDAILDEPNVWQISALRDALG